MSFENLEKASWNGKAGQTSSSNEPLLSLGDPNRGGEFAGSSSRPIISSLSAVSLVSPFQQSAITTSGSMEVDDRMGVTIHELISSVQQTASNVRQMQRICDLLGGPQDSHENGITELTKDLITQTTANLKSIPTASLGEETRLQLKKLTRDHQQVMLHFQTIQKKSIAKCREFVIEAEAEKQRERAQVARDQMASSSTNPTMEAQLDETGQNDNWSNNERSRLLAVASDKQLQQAGGLDQEIAYNRALINEREQGIEEIERAMEEVAEIFRDLGTLVSDQQGLMDNIEATIESAAGRTKAAVRELRVARESRRRSRGSLICILLFILIIGIIIISIIISL